MLVICQILEGLIRVGVVQEPSELTMQKRRSYCRWLRILSLADETLIRLAMRCDEYMSRGY